MIDDTESVSDTKNERYCCPQWWAHPEAVNRLTALHAAYRQAVADDTMSAWWIQHWDSHARVLFSQHGPLRIARLGTLSTAAQKSTNHGW